MAQWHNGDEWDPEKEIYLPSLYRAPVLQSNVSNTFTPMNPGGSQVTTNTGGTQVTTNTGGSQVTTTVNSNVNTPGTINTTNRRPVTGGSNRNYYTP